MPLDGTQYTNAAPSDYAETKADSKDESQDEPGGYGQVIEYIEDRLFLASYTHAPDENTPFPYPIRPETPLDKRASQQDPPSPVYPKPIYMTAESSLLYNAFFADFGPLHAGHMYRFAVSMHDMLEVQQREGRVIVFWSFADSRSRANAACLLACYMCVLQKWPPHLALAPISQMDPPPMPFRDAGYSQSDYTLSIQDVVYGVWRAKQERLFSFRAFNLAEYECFERVDMGDFNWITPDFVAFASPQHKPIAAIPPSSAEFAKLPHNTATIMHSNLPTRFKNVLAHFRRRRVGLVVRLNSELYSPSYFAAVGITHVDMIFEDGTCPTLHIVRKFIKLAGSMIAQKQAIGVHCKAGLGRTGCLIGAYLIYRHGFTANEVIAFMRFMRPGMVVGPQQHWLHLNQTIFRQWWFEDCFREQLAAAKATTPPRKTTRVASNGQTFTPPEQQQQTSAARVKKRLALGERDYNDAGPGVREEHLPAPTPGQPRKMNKIFSSVQPFTDTENRPVQPEPEVGTSQSQSQSPRRVDLPQADGESDEEYKLRLLGTNRRVERPTSVAHHAKSLSRLSTTTTTEQRQEWLSGDRSGDALLESPTARKTPPVGRMGIGGLNIVKRGGEIRKVSSGGIRKTSGRIGSSGAVTGLTRLKQ